MEQPVYITRLAGAMLFIVGFAAGFGVATIVVSLVVHIKRAGGV